MSAISCVNIINYLDSKDGARSCLDAVQKSAELVSEVYAKYRPNSESLGVLNAIDSQLGTTTSVLGFTLIPSVTTEMVNSLLALREVDGSKKIGKAAKDTFDAIATYGYCLEVFKSTILGKVAQVAELSSDLLELQSSYGDYSKASELNHTSKKYHFLRIVRAIASIAAAIFVFVSLAMGVEFISTLSLSLFAAVVGIARDLHKSSEELSDREQVPTAQVALQPLQVSEVIG